MKLAEADVYGIGFRYGMELNYSANVNSVPESQQHAISQNESVVPRTSSGGGGVSAVMDGTSKGGMAISHDGDDSLSDNATCKRPRSSNSKALFLQGAARSEREQPRPRQRRRQQPEYSTRGREEQFNRHWRQYVGLSPLSQTR